MVDWDVAAGRLAPYWLTVASSLFIMAYFYGTYSDEGYAAFSAGLFVPVRKRWSWRALLRFSFMNIDVLTNIHCSSTAAGRDTGCEGCGLDQRSRWNRRSDLRRERCLRLAFDESQAPVVARQLV